MNIVKMNRVPGEPWGFHLHEVGQARTIARVDPGSVSSREGQLQVGMAVLRIGDEAVDGMPMVDLAKLVRDGGDVITLTLTAAAAKTTAQPRRTAVPNPAMTVAVPRGEGWQQLPSGKLAHPGGTWVFDGSTQTTYLLQHLGFRETGPQFCERFTDHIIRAAQLSTGNCIAGQLVPNANPRCRHLPPPPPPFHPSPSHSPHAPRSRSRSSRNTAHRPLPSTPMHQHHAVCVAWVCGWVWVVCVFGGG